MTPWVLCTNETAPVRPNRVVPCLAGPPPFDVQLSRALSFPQKSYNHNHVVDSRGRDPEYDNCHRGRGTLAGVHLVLSVLPLTT